MKTEKYRWSMADYPETHGHTVFSCFSCGGGSTMGYKLAGFDVIGNCEIIAKVNDVYVKNHKPKYNYCADIRALREMELPAELHSLDILDGSPPCSAFSLTGLREKTWGVERTYVEGAVKQRLDDLFFEYIALADKLKPKIVVAENVKGLICGNAKGYVNEIIRKLREAGYTVQIFLLNSAFMEVPQRRERVFFIARREDLNWTDIKMEFDYKPILFGEVRSEKGRELKGSVYTRLLKYRRPGDNSISDIYKRIRGRKSGANTKIDSDDAVASTLLTDRHIRMYDGLQYSDSDIATVQTFPVDYDYCGQSVQYICGMSVPPKMMYHIARQIYLQWLENS